MLTAVGENSMKNVFSDTIYLYGPEILLISWQEKSPEPQFLSQHFPHRLGDMLGDHIKENGKFWKISCQYLENKILYLLQKKISKSIQRFSFYDIFSMENIEKIQNWVKLDQGSSISILGKLQPKQCGNTLSNTQSWLTIIPGP